MINRNNSSPQANKYVKNSHYKRLNSSTHSTTTTFATKTPSKSTPTTATTSTTLLPFYQTMTRDHRYDYARMYINVHNSADSNILQKFFREFCTPGCRHICEFPAASRFNGTRTRRSKNREELIADVLSDVGNFPDLTCHLLDCKLIERKGYVGSQLVFRMISKGTAYRRTDQTLEAAATATAASMNCANMLANRRAYYSSSSSSSSRSNKVLCVHQRQMRQYETMLIQQQQEQGLVADESMDSDCSISSSSATSTSTSSSDSTTTTCASSSQQICYCSPSSQETIEEMRGVNEGEEEISREKERAKGDKLMNMEEEVEECLLCQAAIALSITTTNKNKNNNNNTSNITATVSSPLIFDSPVAITTRPTVTFYLDEFHRIYCYEILAYE